MDRHDTLNYAQAPHSLRGLLAPVGTALCLYPLILVGALYATWFTAWAILGHRPVPSLDDPRSISRAVDVPYFVFFPLLLGMFPALGLHVAVVIVLMVADLRKRRARGAALALVAATLWAGAILFLRADPWRVGEWYMD
jgi:hypothetical protein